MYTMPITQDLMYTVYMFIFYIALANIIWHYRYITQIHMILCSSIGASLVFQDKHATVVRWLLVEFEQQSQNIYESK